MLNPLAKTPFVSLLIPLIGGIVAQYYLEIDNWSIALFLLGAFCMFFSYLIPPAKEYNWRWLFGLGLSLSFVSIGIFSTSIRQQQTLFSFPQQERIYTGVVVDLPQQKARSMAYKVQLAHEGKQIICYLQPDNSRKPLDLGDEFVFRGTITSFQNAGNPDDFDYVSYMHNNGFSGSIYLGANTWQATGNSSSSIFIQALHCRQKILLFYQSVGFSNDEYALLSALTLGYKDALSEDLKQSFRATGTAHVLAVSGLHVFIIYGVVLFFLGFIKRYSRYYWVQQVLIILFLWGYTFLIGLPPSVIRASIMLSLFCFAEIVGKKGFSFNTLAAACFFMLLCKPLWLFDVGFQLSFSSVTAILYLQPKVSHLFHIQNKYLHKGWGVLSLSFVAQLGTFPLCLYYFGTFPTYFFLSNLVIIPLATLIIYSGVALLFAKAIVLFIPSLSLFIYYLPIKALQFSVWLINEILNFLEQLPFALIQDVYISFFDLCLLLLPLFSILLFLIYKKPKALILGLIGLLSLLSVHLYKHVSSRENTLIVYNRRGETEVKWNINHQEFKIIGADIENYKFITLDTCKLLIVAHDVWGGKQTRIKYKLDYLLLTKDNTLSIYYLTNMFDPNKIVLDASLSKSGRQRMINECKEMNLPYYDVSENGAYRVIF